MQRKEKQGVHLMFESFTHFFHEIYERVAGEVDE